MKVAVIGAGARGTTVASVIAENTPTTIWAREHEVAEAITSRRENPLFLEGHTLHSALRATTSRRGCRRRRGRCECSSPQSRNRHVGTELGQGRSLDEVIAEMHAVAEGVRTVPSVLELARRHDVDMPISLQVHAVLYEGKQPRDAVSSMMERESKSELDGLL